MIRYSGSGSGAAVFASCCWSTRSLPRRPPAPVKPPQNAGMNAIARKLGMTFREVADVGPWKANNVYAITRDEWAAHLREAE